MEGALEPGQQAIWTFDGEADQAITIILQPDADSDMSLELQDAAGTTIDLADEGYSGEEERIEGRLPAAGTYQILVDEYLGIATDLEVETRGVPYDIGVRGDSLIVDLSLIHI
mgnify:CR=1 FL=1